MFGPCIVFILAYLLHLGRVQMANTYLLTMEQSVETSLPMHSADFLKKHPEVAHLLQEAVVP